MLTVSQGGVDTCLKVIEAYEKDPGFKKALEELKKAQAGRKKTDAEVAEQEARLKKAGDDAAAKERRAADRLNQLSLFEKTLARKEAELNQADADFKADMQRKQAVLAADRKALETLEARLHSLDAELKAQQSGILTREEKLRQERAAFETWYAQVMNALQKPAEVA